MKFARHNAIYSVHASELLIYSTVFSTHFAFSKCLQTYRKNSKNKPLHV